MCFKTQHPTGGRGCCASHVDIVAWTHVRPSLLELSCGTSPPCPLPASSPAAARPAPQPAPPVHTPCISGRRTNGQCQESTHHSRNSWFGTRDSIHSFLHMKHSKVCWTFEQHNHTFTIQRHQLAWSASLVGGREICMTRRDEEEMQTPYRKAPGVRNWIGNLSAVRCRPEHRCVLQQRINNNYYNYWQHERVHHLLWGGIALQHVLFL